jgi:hypothetical protein
MSWKSVVDVGAAPGDHLGQHRNTAATEVTGQLGRKEMRPSVWLSTTLIFVRCLVGDDAQAYDS